MTDLQIQTMEALYERYRWIVWKKNRFDIVPLFADFDSNDWNFIRSAIDSWVDNHVEEWCVYAAGEYREPRQAAPEDDRRREVAGAL